jgi:hypothetical protein
MTTIEIIAKLKSIEPGKWFSVVNRNGDDLTELIKDLIDGKEHFEFSDDWKRFKRLQDWG